MYYLLRNGLYYFDIDRSGCHVDSSADSEISGLIALTNRRAIGSRLGQWQCLLSYQSQLPLTGRRFEPEGLNLHHSEHRSNSFFCYIVLKFFLPSMFLFINGIK